MKKTMTTTQSGEGNLIKNNFNQIIQRIAVAKTNRVFIYKGLQLSMGKFSFLTVSKFARVSNVYSTEVCFKCFNV